MPRKLIILTTLLGLLIGTIGLPTNVHACRMAKEEKVAKTCGMCAPSHQEGGEKEENPCCQDRLELQHTDDASPVKAEMQVASPVIVALLVWSFVRTEILSSAFHAFSARAHSPPLEKRKQSTYLFNSSFLI